jgi:Spy/CpxP family protein refolding chaperone
MKRFFLLLTVGALMAYPVHAQDDSSTNAPSEGGHHHGGMNFLTADQKAELKAAHDKAIAADPSLATQEQQLKADHKDGQKPTEEQMAAFKAFRQKMDAAMVAADANVAPILAEIKAHHHHGGPDGAGGPPPSDQ